MFICIITCTPHQPLKDSGERRRGEGRGRGEREARGRIGLIVSRAERRQYRCPSYNQQRATRQEEKNPKQNSKGEKKSRQDLQLMQRSFSSNTAGFVARRKAAERRVEERDAQQHRCMFADGLLLSFFLFFLSLTKRRQNKQTQND